MSTDVSVEAAIYEGVESTETPLPGQKKATTTRSWKFRKETDAQLNSGEHAELRLAKFYVKSTQ
jgi:hypothetical protein